MLSLVFGTICLVLTTRLDKLLLLTASYFPSSCYNKVAAAAAVFVVVVDNCQIAIFT